MMSDIYSQIMEQIQTITDTLAHIQEKQETVDKGMQEANKRLDKERIA